MGYGWRILRNNTEGEKPDLDERDLREENLFRIPPWTKIPCESKGIVSLRTKLCAVLQDHVSQKLPEVEDKIKQHVSELKAKISHYPERKDGDWNLRLLRLTDKFKALAEQATGAREKSSEFFGQTLSSTKSFEEMLRRNLRSQVRNMNNDFITVLETCGSKHIIQWQNSGGEEDLQPRVRLPCPEQADLFRHYNSHPSQPISQAEFETYIETLAALYRGNDLPGTYEARMARIVFDNQSTSWKDIASRHIDLVVSEAKFVVLEILRHITEHDRETHNRIVDTFVEPFFKERHKALSLKLDELIPVADGSCYLSRMMQNFLDEQNIDACVARQSNGKSSQQHRTVNYRKCHTTAVLPRIL